MTRRPRNAKAEPEDLAPARSASDRLRKRGKPRLLDAVLAHYSQLIALASVLNAQEDRQDARSRR